MHNLIACRASMQGGDSIFDRVKRSTQGNWQLILPALGVPAEFLKRRHGPCPVCGGKDRFRFDDKAGDGTYYCNGCGSGDGIALVALCRNVRPYDAAKMIDEMLGGVPIEPYLYRTTRTESASDKDARVLAWKRKEITRIWKESTPLAPGDPSYAYLSQTRGLGEQLPDTLRCHQSLEYFHDGRSYGSFACMIAPIINSHWQHIGIHRTYLSDDKPPRKADVPQPKKFLTGADIKGAVIPLYPIGERLGVAEGIETAIACTVASGIPTWAALSSSLMPSIVLPAVKEILIFADEGKAGQKAAYDLAYKAASAGRRAKVVSAPDDDWATVITGVAS